MKDQKLFNRLKSHTTELPNGCWEWQGAIGGSGYGNTWLSNGKYTNAHRAMYFAVHGIPRGKYSICHKCDNKLCVNPEHLFKATQKGNLEDMHRKGRNAKGPTLSEAIRQGWTPEKRVRRAEQTRQRMAKIHELLTKEAGVPYDWKYCPSCKIWKSRSEFYKNRAAHNGIKAYCKPCDISREMTRRRRK